MIRKFSAVRRSVELHEFGYSLRKIREFLRCELSERKLNLISVSFCVVEMGRSWFTLYELNYSVVAVHLFLHLKIFTQERIVYYSASALASCLPDIAWTLFPFDDLWKPSLFVCNFL